MYDFNLGEIYDSGALLTRLKGDPPNDEWEMDPGHVYWNPHVDKVCGIYVLSLCACRSQGIDYVTFQLANKAETGRIPCPK